MSMKAYEIRMHSRHGHRWTTAELQSLIGAWLRGESTANICKMFSLSESGLNKLVQRLRKDGIPLPERRRGHKAGRRNCPWTQGEIETLFRMISSGASTRDVANELDRTFYGVQNMILRLRGAEGVPLAARAHGRARLWDAQSLISGIASGSLPQVLEINQAKEAGAGE